MPESQSFGNQSQTTLPAEAVEKAVEALDPYVALGKYVGDAAMHSLAAAYPALRAHIIRELANEAEAERQRFEMEHRFPSDPRRHHIDIRTTLEGLSRARAASRWLSARADQTKENQ